MAYHDGTSQGAVFGALGYIASGMLGVITVSSLSEALVLGGFSALGGLLVKWLINKVVKFFKTK